MTTNSYDIFDTPNEGVGTCFMAKGPKVSHPEYVNFNSDEDDLLGDDLLVDNSSDEYMMKRQLIMLIKIKRMTMIRRRLRL